MAESFKRAARRNDRIAKVLVNHPAPQQLLQYIAASENPYLPNVKENVTGTHRMLRRYELTTLTNRLAQEQGIEKPIKGIYLIPPKEDRHPDPAMR